MTLSEHVPPTVEVMWRPGCPFCASLRRGLRRAGVATVEHDIWSSPDAAARVRQATGGDETVPTVFVGERAMVNPSVPQVVAALKAVDPDYQPDPTPASGAAGGRATLLGPGLTWTLTVALVWAALADWRPATTWHLAPLLLAAAWPWVVGQDSSPGDRSARRSILLAGGAGLGAAAVLTGALAATGRLDGPTWTGSGTPVHEALLLSVGGAAIATAVGLVRTVRRTPGASARLGSTQIATSDDIVALEGNAYFPLASVADGVLHPSSTTTVCPWKGIASYYDVHVDGLVVPDGAFTYRHPTPVVRRIKGRVAFWKGIEIDASAPGADGRRPGGVAPRQRG